MIHRIPQLLVAGALALGVVACGGAPMPQTGTTTAPQRNVKEVALVSAVRPTIVTTQDLVKRGDFSGARKAFVEFNAGWNGVEVYTNFRSRQLYAELETDLEAKVQAGLDAAQPSTSTLVPLLDAMLAKYDEVIRLSAEGPAISPLFDDVAGVRMTRASLRQVSPALKAGDLATAKTQYAVFQRDWPKAEPLLRRSTDAFAEVLAAKTKADDAFKAEKPTAELAPLVDVLSERYNYGLNLVNAAARNADLAKTTFTADDLKNVGGFAAIEADLRANRPTVAHFDAVAGALKAKAADSTLRSALDAAKPGAATKTAIEAVWVAQQVLVGQFWLEPRLQDEIAKQRIVLGLPRI